MHKFIKIRLAKEFLVEVIKKEYKLLICILFVFFLVFLKFNDIIEGEGQAKQQPLIGTIANRRYFDSSWHTHFMYEIITSEGIKVSANSFWECRAVIGDYVKYVKYKSLLQGTKYEITDCPRIKVS